MQANYLIDFVIEIFLMFFQSFRFECTRNDDASRNEHQQLEIPPEYVNKPAKS